MANDQFTKNIFVQMQEDEESFRTLNGLYTYVLRYLLNRKNKIIEMLRKGEPISFNTNKEKICHVINQQVNDVDELDDYLTGLMFEDDFPKKIYYLVQIELITNDKKKDSFFHYHFSNDLYLRKNIIQYFQNSILKEVVRKSVFINLGDEYDTAYEINPDYKEEIIDSLEAIEYSLKPMEYNISKIIDNNSNLPEIYESLKNLVNSLPNKSDIIRRIVKHSSSPFVDDPLNIYTTIVKQLYHESKFYRKDLEKYIIFKTGTNKTDFNKLKPKDKEAFVFNYLNEDTIQQSLEDQTYYRKCKIDALKRQMKKKFSNDSKAIEYVSDILGKYHLHSIDELMDYLSDDICDEILEMLIDFLSTYASDKNKKDFKKSNKKDFKKSNKKDFKKSFKFSLPKAIVLADDLVKGKFTNSTTKENLYRFGLAFHLHYYPKNDPQRNKSDDLIKNLFYDYYNENMLDYIKSFDNSKLQIDLEPIGLGPNYKNYKEMIYLYCSQKRFDGSDKISMVDEKVCSVKKIEQNQQYLDQEYAQNTRIFRKNFDEKAFELDCDEFVEYLSKHYKLQDEKRNDAMNVGSQQKTAHRYYHQIKDGILVLLGVFFDYGITEKINEKETKKGKIKFKTNQVNYDDKEALKYLNMSNFQLNGVQMTTKEIFDRLNKEINGFTGNDKEIRRQNLETFEISYALYDENAQKENINDFQFVLHSLNEMVSLTEYKEHLNDGTKIEDHSKIGYLEKLLRGINPNYKVKKNTKSQNADTIGWAYTMVDDSSVTRTFIEVLYTYFYLLAMSLFFTFSDMRVSGNLISIDEFVNDYYKGGLPWTSSQDAHILFKNDKYSYLNEGAIEILNKVETITDQGLDEVLDQCGFTPINNKCFIDDFIRYILINKANEVSDELVD